MPHTIELTTKRCRIRRFEESDLDGLMRYRNDAQWMRYQNFKCRTRREYAEVLLREPTLESGLQLAVVDAASGDLIGDLYLRQAAGAIWLGYAVDPRYAGRGYAFEAATALLGWIARQGYSDVRAGVLPENIASIRLLNKLGFAYAGADEDGEWIYALNLRTPNDGI